MDARRLDEVFMDCLYTEEETKDLHEGRVPEGTVLVEGVVRNYGLHGGRLESHREEVRAMVNEMPEAFFPGTGDGWSFLNLCETRKGERWGQHRNMEQLCVLAIGLGMGHWLLPRPSWSAMPGGMPYIAFDTREKGGADAVAFPA